MSYLYDALHPVFRQERTNAAVTALKGIKFDALVGTGMSGALIGGIVAAAVKKPLVLIRKPHDQVPSVTHGWPIEGKDVVGLYKRYLFIDDLVDTGATRDRVIKTVKEEFTKGSMVVGEYLFNSNRLKMYDLGTT